MSINYGKAHYKAAINTGTLQDPYWWDCNDDSVYSKNNLSWIISGGTPVLLMYKFVTRQPGKKEKVHQLVQFQIAQIDQKIEELQREKRSWGKVVLYCYSKVIVVSLYTY